MAGTSTGSGLWFTDETGHGTHCAGIIGAVGDNEKGVVGIRNSSTQLHIGRALDGENAGYESDILEAVEGCVQNGAKVINLSFGGTSSSRTASRYYRDLFDEGLLLVAAAGNSGSSELVYPAAYPSVISVGAVDASEKRARFSECNSQVELVAPGVRILSTVPNNGYEVKSGTSELKFCLPWYFVNPTVTC